MTARAHERQAQLGEHAKIGKSSGIRDVVVLPVRFLVSQGLGATVNGLNALQPERFDGLGQEPDFLHRAVQQRDVQVGPHDLDRHSGEPRAGAHVNHPRALSRLERPQAQKRIQIVLGHDAFAAR